jgi:hypothetical protein
MLLPTLTLGSHWHGAVLTLALRCVCCIHHVSNNNAAIVNLPENYSHTLSVGLAIQLAVGSRTYSKDACFVRSLHGPMPSRPRSLDG